LIAILNLKFPFELKRDQRQAVNAWLNNGFRGSIIYSTGTGKTEIAFECARRLAEIKHSNNIMLYSKDSREHKLNQKFGILFLVPRIVLIDRT
jgi:superfamily II DNA or RNA helicase